MVKEARLSQISVIIEASFQFKSRRTASRRTFEKKVIVSSLSQLIAVSSDILLFLELLLLLLNLQITSIARCFTQSVHIALFMSA